MGSGTEPLKELCGSACRTVALKNGKRVVQG